MVAVNAQDEWHWECCSKYAKHESEGKTTNQFRRPEEESRHMNR